MSDRQAAVLAFKLLGLWLVAYAVIGAASMPYIWQTSAAEVRNWTVLFLFLPSLVSLGVGVPVWFSAEWFAARVFPASGGEREPGQAGVSPGPMFALGASLVGLFLVAEGVPALASAAYLFGKSMQHGVLGVDEGRRQLLWDASAKAVAFAGLTRLAIGLALLAGPARLAAGVARIRKEFSGSLAEEEEAKRS